MCSLDDPARTFRIISLFFFPFPCQCRQAQKYHEFDRGEGLSRRRRRRRRQHAHRQTELPQLVSDRRRRRRRRPSERRLPPSNPPCLLLPACPNGLLPSLPSLKLSIRFENFTHNSDAQRSFSLRFLSFLPEKDTYIGLGGTALQGRTSRISR